MRTASGIAVLAEAIFAQSACSGSESGAGPPDGHDAGTDAVVDAGTSDGDSHCTALEVTGDVIIGEWVKGPPPTPAGGAIADGTYDAIAFETYVSELPPPDYQPPREFRSALLVSGGATRFELVDSSLSPSGGEFVLRYHGELTVTEPDVLVSWLCPAELVNNRETWQFSTTGNQLVFHIESSATTFALR